MKWFFVFLLSAFSHTGYSQITQIMVSPQETDSSISEPFLDHEILIGRGNRVGKLLLLLGGTGSEPNQYRALRTYAAEEGFTSISLSYPNTIATASLSAETEQQVFDQYREEICFGTPVSDDVQVDTINAIYNRLRKLLIYLRGSNSNIDWNPYIDNTDEIIWANLVLAGHSQGAGHAPYLAKRFAVDRVLMFSGPNDYSDHFSASAPWLSEAGQTSTLRHFAYLSLFDEAVSFNKQLTNLKSLGLLDQSDTVWVDQALPPYGTSQILYTTQNPGLVLLHHNVPVKNSTLNEVVWKYMLTADAITSDDHPGRMEMNLYPNPTTEEIMVCGSRSNTTGTFTIYEITGKQIMKGQMASTKCQSVDLSGLQAGSYIFGFGNFVRQFMVVH